MGKDYIVQCSSYEVEVASGRIYTTVFITSPKTDNEIEEKVFKYERIPILKLSYNTPDRKDACNFTQAAAFSLAQFLDRYQTDANVKEIFVKEGDTWLLKYSQDNNSDGGISIEKQLDGVVVRLVPGINEKTGYPYYNIYIMYKNDSEDVKMINIERCMINDLKTLSNHLFTFAYNCPLYTHIYVENRRWAMSESISNMSMQEMLFKK